MDIVTEEWRTIPDAKHYEVSNFGRVRSVRGGSRMLRQRKHTGGYRQTLLWVNRKPVYRFTHRLVATVFLGVPAEPTLTVNHKDGVKTNNAASNLEWVTQKQNNEHAVAIGLRNPFGEGNALSKLTENNVLAIRRLCVRGRSVAALARKYGVSNSVISEISCGIAWPHVGGPLRTRPKLPPRIPAETVRRILVLHKTGMRKCDIARAVGICRDNVKNIIKRKAHLVHD